MVTARLAFIRRRSAKDTLTLPVHSPTTAAAGFKTNDLQPPKSVWRHKGRTLPQRTNQFQGKIKSVKLGNVMAEVVVDMDE